MLEKVADSARKAVKLAEPYKPYGGQFLEFCSISLSIYQTCMKRTRKSTEFCQFFGRHYPHMPRADIMNLPSQMGRRYFSPGIVNLVIIHNNAGCTVEDFHFEKQFSLSGLENLNAAVSIVGYNYQVWVS